MELSRFWAPTNVYPRNDKRRSFEAYFAGQGQIPAEEASSLNYTPLRAFRDWSTIVSDVVPLAAGGKQVGVISTIQTAMRMLGSTPNWAAAEGCSGAERYSRWLLSLWVKKNCRGLDTAPLGRASGGAAWNYFMVC